MKKFLISIFVFLSVMCTPLFAGQQEFLFDLGLEGAMKVYSYEQVSYSYRWDNDIGLGAEMRVVNNIFRDSTTQPFCYFMPSLYVDFGGFYLSGGAMFYDGMPDLSYTTIQARVGYRLNPWNWGAGKGGIDIGCEFSPTLYTLSGEEAGGDASAALGSALLSLFNLFKLSAGITWRLPL